MKKIYQNVYLRKQTKLNFMANNLFGRFYFKKTSNGNLVGEFSNNISRSISTESADKVESSDSYIGKYNTTWQENGVVRFAKLNISQKQETGNMIFTLEWKENDKLIFVGEGMFCDNILIGDYQGV
jgi:hypothetical protein